MEVRAIAKYVRAQPKKLRTVAREIAGKPAARGSVLLRFHPSKSARVLRKVLESAIANATENHGLSAEELVVAKVAVDEGPRLKRVTQRAMGRGNRIMKPTAHITVVVAEEEPKPRIRPHGAKAKARPKFAPGKKAKPAQKAAGAAAVPEVGAEPMVAESPSAEAQAAESAASAIQTGAEPAAAQEATTEARAPETTAAASQTGTERAAAQETATEARAPEDTATDQPGAPGETEPDSDEKR
jgi:large subunit ribosomal protein L22